MSRHYSLTRPGRHLQSALRTGAYDYHWGHDLCHGAYTVPKCLRALPVTAGSDGGSRGRRVYAHDPRHVAAAVLQSQDDSDGHGAAGIMDKADRARKRTGADMSCQIILLLEG